MKLCSRLLNDASAWQLALALHFPPGSALIWWSIVFWAGTSTISRPICYLDILDAPRTPNTFPRNAAARADCSQPAAQHCQILD